MASILGGIAAAVAALATGDGVGNADAFAGVVVIALGILGAALSIKHYERNRMHTRILGEIRAEISDLQHDPGRAPRTTQAIRRAGEGKHNERFALFDKKPDRPGKRVRSPWVKVRLHYLWIALNLSIALVGVLIIVASRFWR
ncbi:MAG: hypothetical protein M3323_02440 [Actinomycetota bacterium]|nr:hypothetical protein [Actinomycetota bacterium]